MKNNGKKHTFCAQEFGVKVLICTRQEREWKYPTI